MVLFYVFLALSVQLASCADINLGFFPVISDDCQTVTDSQTYAINWFNDETVFCGANDVPKFISVYNTGNDFCFLDNRVTTVFGTSTAQAATRVFQGCTADRKVCAYAASYQQFSVVATSFTFPARDVLCTTGDSQQGGGHDWQGNPTVQSLRDPPVLPGPFTFGNQYSWVGISPSHSEQPAPFAEDTCYHPTTAGGSPYGSYASYCDWQLLAARFEANPAWGSPCDFKCCTELGTGLTYPTSADCPACSDLVPECGSAAPTAAPTGALPTTPFTCTGDFDGSGEVNVSDLANLLSAWGSVDPSSPYDINSNGSVDVEDLAQFLSRWGACPLGRR